MNSHILRQDRNNNNCNIAISWVPGGGRRRPKTTWRRTVEKESKKAAWSSWEETTMIKLSGDYLDLSTGLIM